MVLGFVSSFFLGPLDIRLACAFRIFLIFLREAWVAIYFPLRTTFAVSHRFWTNVFSFSLVSVNHLSSLISWLTHSFFSRMLFNLQAFEFLPNFFLWLSSNFKALWSENMQVIISIFGISWGMICDPVCDLFWRKFHVHTEKFPNLRKETSIHI